MGRDKLVPPLPIWCLGFGIWSFCAKRGLPLANRCTPAIITADVGNLIVIQTSAIHNDQDSLSMRGVSSSLFRWVTVAEFGSSRFHFRRKQAEFPVTHQNACNLRYEPFAGRCAAGRASIDALRRTNNSVNIEDQHEISFIREALAAFARRLSPKGRPRASSGIATQSRPQADILAATRGFFRQRQNPEKTSHGKSQRLSAACAAAAAPA